MSTRRAQDAKKPAALCSRDRLRRNVISLSLTESN
jgi:hypothetical protein